MLRAFLHLAVTCCIALVGVGTSFEMSKLRQQHPTCHNMVAKRAKHTVPDNITIRRVEMLLSFGQGLKEKLKENRSHLELHLRRRLTGRPYFGKV